MGNTKKTNEYKIVHFSKVYKFCLIYFQLKCIFFVSIQKNTFKMKTSQFLDSIYEKVNNFFSFLRHLDENKLF